MMLVPEPGRFDTTAASGFPAKTSIAVMPAIAMTNTTRAAPARLRQRGRPLRVLDRSQARMSCHGPSRPTAALAS
jgi:hypothetical protein